MDGETIRLMIVAFGSIAAGLGGAVIAGAYNSRNTLATIEAARTAAETRREADQDVEHDRWLRDRKIEVYSKFLEEVHELRLSLAEVQVGFHQDTNEVVKKARDLSLLHLHVLAPRLVLAAAQDVMKSIRSLMDQLISIKERTAQNTEAYDAEADDFREKVTLLELRISDDLGIDVVA